MTNITQSELRALFDYDAETGVFTRRVDMALHKFKAGSPAGLGKHGSHAQIKIRGRSYKTHRLAWLYVYGEWPNGWLDHVNRNPSDNRIANLRVATPSQNKMNCDLRADNSSGHKGVTWVSSRRRWVSHCTVNKVRKQLGYFKDKQAAIDAYETYAKAHHGDFYCSGGE